jgi:hypothetical protein
MKNGLRLAYIGLEISSVDLGGKSGYYAGHRQNCCIANWQYLMYENLDSKLLLTINLLQRCDEKSWPFLWK